MADEKQLTVAELLARNQAAPAADGEPAPRRRRRRSLEDGGISVAELTGNIRRVESAPAGPKHSDSDSDEAAPVIPAPQPAPELAVEPAAAPQLAAAENTDAAADDTVIMKRVTATPPANQRPAHQRPVQQRPASQSAAPAPASSPATDDTGEIDPVGEFAALSPALAAAATGIPTGAASQDNDAPRASDPFQSGTGHKPAPVVAATEPAAAADDEKINPVAVVVLSVLGIILGAVVFKGFEILWSRLDGLLVGILALAVTAAMVGVIHALRTSRDTLSMGLAVVVGLVLSFGPLLVV